MDLVLKKGSSLFFNHSIVIGGQKLLQNHILSSIQSDTFILWSKLGQVFISKAPIDLLYLINDTTGDQLFGKNLSITVFADAIEIHREAHLKSFRNYLQPPP